MEPKGQDEGTATGDNGIDLVRLMSALAARKSWIIIPTVLSFVAALIFITVVSPRYTAAAKVTLENQENYFNRPDKSGADLSTPSIYDAEGVQSEAETIATDELARKAVQKLGLVKLGEFNPEGHGIVAFFSSLFGGHPYAEGEDRAVENFLQRLTVFPLAKSRVLQFEFSSSNPELAAEGANTAASLYLTAKEEAGKAETRANAAWLSASIDKLRARSADADAKLEAYRSETGLLTGANGLTLPSQQLAEINAQIAAARSAQSSAAAKAQVLRQMLHDGRLDAIADVAKDDSLRRYAELRVSLKAQMAEESRTLLPGHPRMQELAGKISGLESEMRIAAAKVVTGLEDESRLAGAQVQSLDAAINKQSKAVSSGNVDIVRLRALELDAKTSHDQLETYIEKYHEAIARDADNAQPPNARITSKAVVPRTPTFPKKIPTLLLATLAGFFIATGAVIARALLMDGPPAAASRAAPAFAARRTPPLDEPREPAFSQAAAPSPKSPLSSSPEELSPIEAYADRLADVATPGASVPILVASDGMGGALAPALSAARRLAKRGRTVLLDLGESQPWLADTFDRAVDEGSAHLGLSDVLDGRATVTQALHRDLSSPLDIMPAGLGEIATGELGVVLDVFAESYAFVVLHASDWRAPAAQAIVAYVASVVLCAPENRLGSALLLLEADLADPSIVIKGISTRAGRESAVRAA